MRINATEAEAKLWGILRDRRLAGHKFRRQVPIGRYIVDFMCASAQLIVELDGSQHAEDPTDQVRDRWLNSAGYRILRVWNNELTDNRDGVLEAIWYALQTPPHPALRAPLSREGERGGSELAERGSGEAESATHTLPGEHP